MSPKWAGAAPLDTRAADTQKCIRAGGKHNDLEDVGSTPTTTPSSRCWATGPSATTSKRRPSTWGWELLTKVWGIPPKRLYATVYRPTRPRATPPSSTRKPTTSGPAIFRAEGLDPAVHIVNGNKKDNFWMMGDTGPCGPCSESTSTSPPPATPAASWSTGLPRCIEIWNHVFIQFNANADGTFSPLPARHVDTGMGFERVAGIQGHDKGLHRFPPPPSNYNADVFTSLFDRIAKLSGKRYTRTLPTSRAANSAPVRAGEDRRRLPRARRPYPHPLLRHRRRHPARQRRPQLRLRRILRRGILYGRKASASQTGFFEKLVARSSPRSAPSSPNSAPAAVDDRARDPLRGGNLRPHPRPRHAALRRSPPRPAGSSGATPSSSTTPTASRST
jgi:alanyl-tRNA synthetase